MLFHYLTNNMIHVEIGKALSNNSKDTMVIEIIARYLNVAFLKFVEEILIVEGKDEFNHFMIVTDTDSNSIVVVKDVCIERTGDRMNSKTSVRFVLGFKRVEEGTRQIHLIRSNRDTRKVRIRTIGGS